MTIMTKILATGTGLAGLAALASAAPATAQYRYGYGYAGAHFAAQRCAAAVDRRRNIEVVAVTRVDPRRNFVRVRGIATDVRLSSFYGPYGIGAYGALGYRYRNRADVAFSCDVDYRGRIRDIDINRRRWR